MPITGLLHVVSLWWALSRIIIGTRWPITWQLKFNFRAARLVTRLFPVHGVDRTLFTPRAHARARGYVIGRGVYI